MFYFLRCDARALLTPDFNCFSYIALCSLKDTYELPNVEPFMYSGDTGDGSDSDEE